MSLSNALGGAIWKNRHAEPANGSTYREYPSFQYRESSGTSCRLLPAQRRKGWALVPIPTSFLGCPLEAAPCYWPELMVLLIDRLEPASRGIGTAPVTAFSGWLRTKA